MSSEGGRGGGKEGGREVGREGGRAMRSKQGVCSQMAWSAVSWLCLGSCTVLKLKEENSVSVTVKEKTAM